MNKNYNNSDYTFRIIFFGDYNVGKTSLFLRYLGEPFDSSFRPLIFKEFENKLIEINNKLIKIQLWDLADTCSNIKESKFYYKLAKGVIVVYDITSRDSFNNSRDWLQKIKKNIKDNIKILLVGNKNDLDFRRCVLYEEGQELADEFSAKFFETSAKNNYNVNEIFNLLIMDIIEELEKDEKTSIKLKNDDINNKNGKCYK